ncbi:MAG: bifunctional metallophosphatase/5'-nucleotidase, partial [Burkholderiaceae bacterium]
MKNIFDRLTLIRLLVVIVSVSTTAISWAAEPIHITLLQLNDVYQISPVDKGKHGGLARVATLKKIIQQESANTLLILGGDTLSPSVASNTFKGAQIIAAWNAVGLDLAVLGNHEFDFGPDILKTRIAESRFTWLGANAIDRATHQPFGGAKRTEIRTYQGIKIGFVGVVTEDTAQSSKPGKGIQFLDSVATARRQAAWLRAHGANIVVAVTHLSMEVDRRLAASGAVDLILGGHDHTLMESLVKHTPIFKMGSDARTLGRVDLFVDPKTKRLAYLNWDSIPVTGETPDDSAVATLIAEYESKLDGLLGMPVGETAVALDARQQTNRSMETNLGSWLADVYRASVNADVAIINGGSIRSNAIFDAGKLTKRDILTLLPFENPIVKVKISGSTLRLALEHGVAEVPNNKEAGQFPQVSGLRFSYDASRPKGARIVDITVGGEPLDDKREYSLALNSYLAEGGDGYAMFKGLPYLLSPENALSETAEVIEALAHQGRIAP